MKKFFILFKENFLFAYCSLLLPFVVLYPKLPLFDLIPGYIVRVRIEDFLILFGIILLFIKTIKSGFSSWLKTPISKPIFLYLLVGFLSMLSALFVTKTVFLEPLHSGKMLVHFLRRVEYFSIFFLFFLSIKNLKQVKFLVFIFMIALVGVNIYGFGQKYLSWPVFSTMNREFSKGFRLVLTEHARVNSSFGGHYDLAAYLVMALILAASLIFGLRNNFLKVLCLIIYVASLYLLILTASRTSFISYMVGLIILIIIFFIKNKKISWLITRGFITIYFSIFVLLSFGELNDRFAQLAGVKQIWSVIGFVKEPLKISVPNHLTLQEELSLISSESDVPPKIASGSKAVVTPAGGAKPSLPPDVTLNIPEKYEVIYVIDETTGKKVATLSAVSRHYSDAAWQVGLSGAIRLDALWPRAWAGFKTNPLLGTGYSTLTKETIAQFTEAESTDNDYLRALGETGVLGFISFFGIIGLCLWLIFGELRKSVNDKKEKDNFFFLSYASYVAFTVGLLINASYIDVFESSKVAFTFWVLTALILKLKELKTFTVKIKLK